MIWAAKSLFPPAIVFLLAIALAKFAPAQVPLPSFLQNSVTVAGMIGVATLICSALLLALSMGRLMITGDRLVIGMIKSTTQSIQIGNIAELRIRKKGIVRLLGLGRGLAIHLSRPVITDSKGRENQWAPKLSRGLNKCDIILPPIYRRSINEIANDLAEAGRTQTGRLIPIFDQAHTGIPINGADTVMSLSDPRMMPYLAVRCVKCEYDLRGLELGGRCPECGTAIEVTMKGESLEHADADWLRSISQGCALFIAAGIVSISTVVFCRPGLLPAPVLLLGGLLGYITSLIVYFVGVALLTCPSSAHEPLHISRPRRLTRILVVGLPLLLLVAGVVHPQKGPALFMAAAFGVFPTLAPVLWYVYTLYSRTGAERGSSIILLTFALFTLFGGATVLAFAMFVIQALMFPTATGASGGKNANPPTLSELQTLHLLFALLALFLGATFVASVAMLSAALARIRERKIAS